MYHQRWNVVILEHILSSSIIRNVCSNSVEKMHVFLVLNVFDPQWLLFFHSTYILGLQSKILSEHTATFSHNKGRRFGETRLVTFSKFCTWEFEINYGKDKRTTVELLLTNSSTTTTLLYDAQFSLLEKIPNNSFLYKKDVSAMIPILYTLLI